jgi:hypothetical protein
MKPDWKDCDGDAELAHAKRKAKATLAHILEDHYVGDQRLIPILINCLDALRDELLALARS